MQLGCQTINFRLRIKYLDHLIQKVIDIAQLGIVLKNAIQSSWKQMFCAYNIGSEVWNKSNYYTPTIPNVFMVFVMIFSMLLLLKIKTLADYLGKIHALFHEFSKLLPHTSTTLEIEQQ